MQIDQFYYKDEHKLNPRFKRSYVKKMKREKKYPECRFIIGVI